MSNVPEPRQIDIEDAIAEAKAAASVGDKAAERQYLESIAPDIERADRSRREREKLEAPVAAQKRAAADNHKPWYDRPIDIPAGKYRVEQKVRRAAELAEQVSVSIAKQRETARRKNAAPLDNRPTPERAAKLVGIQADGQQSTAVDAIAPPITDDDTRASLKAHEVQSVVDYYRRGWTYEELQGGHFLVNAWKEAALGEPRLVANYDGTPGSAFGPRDGGVKRSDKSERFVDAHNQMLNIEAILFTNFGAKGVSMIKWLVWETVKVSRDGAPLSEQMEAAGRALAPFVKDRGRLWGITYGYLKCILRFAYGQWVVKEEAMQRRDSTPEQIAMRRRHRLAKFGAFDVAAAVDERRVALGPRARR